MWVLTRVEMQVAYIILAACPDHRATKGKGIARLEVHATALKGEIGDYKLGAPDVDNNSIADLFREMLLVDADRSESTIIKGRQDSILESVLKLHETPLLRNPNRQCRQQGAPPLAIHPKSRSIVFLHPPVPPSCGCVRAGVSLDPPLVRWPQAEANR
jgi:hypothetical protein